MPPAGNDLAELMEHPENRLLLRFLECVWLYKPLYVIMEEVPDVAKPPLLDFCAAACKDHGYRMSYNKGVITGLQGCPQVCSPCTVSYPTAPRTAPGIPCGPCTWYTVWALRLVYRVGLAPGIPCVPCAWYTQRRWFPAWASKPVTPQAPPTSTSSITHHHSHPHTWVPNSLAPGREGKEKSPRDCFENAFDEAIK
eukprot:2430750-Pyramimonas_sp.AAC.1